MKLKVGTILYGERGYGEACSSGIITGITVIVNDITRLDWFPSRPHIDVMAIIGYLDEVSKIKAAHPANVYLIMQNILVIETFPNVLLTFIS